MALLVETAFANQTVEGSWRRVFEVSTLCIPALFCAVDSSRFQASSLLGFRLSLLCFLTSVSTVSVSSFPQFVLLFAVEPVNTRFDPRWRSTAKMSDSAPWNSQIEDSEQQNRSIAPTEVRKTSQL